MMRAQSNSSTAKYGAQSEWIDENTPEEPERSPRQLGKVEAPVKPQSTRSIFDDIDADEDSESE